MHTAGLELEDAALNRGYKFICGVDEAGRGSLAGPVFAAAVILPPGLIIKGLTDSKKISEKKREILFDVIKEKALAFSISSASVEEIESINILNAAMLAMKRAVESLTIQPDLALIDGNTSPRLEMDTKTVVKGDSLSASIAAASILAKVSRDRALLLLDEQFPEYSFKNHKGYGTKLHYERIEQYGLCSAHRPSFLRKFMEKKS